MWCEFWSSVVEIAGKAAACCRLRRGWWIYLQCLKKWDLGECTSDVRVRLIPMWIDWYADCSENDMIKCRASAGRAAESQGMVVILSSRLSSLWKNTVTQHSDIQRTFPFKMLEKYLNTARRLLCFMWNPSSTPQDIISSTSCLQQFNESATQSIGANYSSITAFCTTRTVFAQQSYQQIQLRSIISPNNRVPAILHMSNNSLMSRILCPRAILSPDQTVTFRDMNQVQRVV